jgi:crotonobetainyl-CoA:carnitine CoA-transferase CaiB-like acyl-CoA transferase
LPPPFARNGAGAKRPVDVKVVEWDAGVAGAVAGLLLSDWGAQVTVIEPPQGSALRTTQWWPVLSRGKDTVTIDWQRGDADQEIQNLLAESNVVIHSYRPGTAPSPLLEGGAEGHLGLISCAITGTNPAVTPELPTDDLLVAAISGRCSNQVGWDEGPSYLAHLVPSVVAGLVATQGVAAALIADRQAGIRSRVETSLFSAALAISELVELDNELLKRDLDRQPQGTSPLYSLYQCSDGQWLQLGCLHSGFVEKAVRVLGIEAELAPLRSLPGFGDGVVPTSDNVRQPFRAAVARSLVRQPRQWWLDRLMAADVPVAPVLRSEEFLAHPQAKANGVMVVADEKLGEVLQPGPFVRYEGARVPEPTPPRGGNPLQGAPLSLHPKTGKATTGRPATENRHGPLSGTTVVEMANIIAGPMAGRCLADLGARVIKLEPLEGDVFRQQGAPEFHALNAGKWGLAVNLKTKEGAAIAETLLSKADVFLNNLRPGAVDRLGLGYDALHELNPRLVWCQISAFGRTGPLAKMPGGDPLAGALTGMQAAQGGRGGRPVYVYGAPIDYTSGFLAAAGIVLALYRRDVTGLGELVDTSLLDAGALLNADALAEYEGRGERECLPVNQYRQEALKGLYPTATGWLALSATGDGETKFWSVMKTHTGKSHPQDDDDDNLARSLWEAFRERPAEEWLPELDAAGVPCAPARDKAALRLSDSAIGGSGMASSYAGALGSASFVDRWLSLSGWTCGSRGPAPALGQHSREILQELGIESDALVALKKAGVVTGDWL